MKYTTLIAILLVIFVQQTQGLHFYLQEGKEKCLMDDIPQGTLVLGYWHFMEPLPGVDQDSTTEGVQIKVIGPNGKEVHQVLTTYQATPQHRGKFSLATPDSGNYKICMKTTTSHWVMENKRVKYGLRLVIGDSEEAEDVAKDHHIGGLQGKINDIKKTALQFVSYQEMTRKQEDKVSEENLKVNDRVVIATIIQTIVILASGVYQIMSLKKFFVQKRLY